MPEYFRKPLSEAEQAATPASYATPDADQAKLDRKKAKLEGIFAKRTLTPEDIAAFTRISGMSVPTSDLPPSGEALRDMLKSGALIRARIAI